MPKLSKLALLAFVQISQSAGAFKGYRAQDAHRKKDLNELFSKNNFA